MKARWWVLGFVIWSVGMLWLGRRTVPDRTEQLMAWRASADSTLRASQARADSARARDSVRIAAADARYERERQRVAGATARADQSEAITDSLKGRLAVVQASADSAAIIHVQEQIIAQQSTTILTLRAGVGDAQEAMAGLRMDLAMVRDDLVEERRESARLRETVAAGLEATKPSRGRSLGFLDCTIGVGATSQGLDYRSATCGVSVRGLIGGR